ncbi:MAG TPA: phosphate acyltransferase, partial [Candidatus Wallbacteria bacterium]|nr:phosphate acyltransferase [Candidatus Wallbacteria bacterium]
ISKKAADKKQINHEGAGDADIFIFPNIETGNLFGKSLTYFANSPSAGLITGAAKQVIMLSRADDHRTKLNSMAIGCLLALAENEN